MRLFPVLVPVEEDRKGLLDHEMMRKSGLLQIAEGLREREHGLDDSWKESSWNGWSYGSSCWS